MGDLAGSGRAEDRVGELATAERVAAQRSMWPDGKLRLQMLQSVGPAAFRAIILADRIATVTRETAEVCSKATAPKARDKAMHVQDRS